MKKQKDSKTATRQRDGRTPEQPEEGDEHPNREDDPGAWSDHDCGWTLGERMPLLLLLGCLLLSGCATKGGWPCWIWQKNTDQKLEKWGKEHLQSLTNAPVKPPQYQWNGNEVSAPK